MTTKEALCNIMSLRAAEANRVRSLYALSKEVPEDLFRKCVRQHPCTMERDLDWATEAFKRAKAEYEAYCAEIGVPAYVTYNED